jgi:protocatechuate 3,4-dioxygenase, alpha subunit
MSDDDLISTPSQTVGPFFHFGLTTPFGRKPGTSAADDQIRVIVRVFDGDGLPLDDAIVEFWQRNVQRTPGSGTEELETSECGRVATDADGSCEIVLTRPQATDSGRARRAAHINLCLFARGLLRQVYTRIYFSGDPALESDPVVALVPADRRATLMARPDGAAPDRWRFDLHLQGPHETVFFDR